jgi:outer membrane protein assembly factor BamD (BamD/ComL family)
MPTLPGSTPPTPGTPSWWRKHKKTAVFTPGKGNQVEGVEGYFDDEGRPIHSQAAKKIGDKNEGGLLGDVDFKHRVQSIKSTVGLGPDQSEANLDFDLGKDYFRNGEFATAAKHFKEAANRWPDSVLEQDAWFYEAESNFFAEKYSKANKIYEKIVKEYPNSPYLDKIVARQFALARYWDEYDKYNPNWPITPNLIDNRRPLFDTVGRSRKTYDNIRITDPTGPLADDAIMAAANSYFLDGRYIDADEQYELLRKEHPRSEHQFNAHILGLQCKLRRYQGPAYDETPLMEAQKLVKQLKMQFAGELDAEQKQRLAQIDGQLRRELAQRDYNMGKYYDDLKEYGSAKFYYAQVLKKHGATPLAEDARTRLAAIETLPDRPTSSIEPLLDLVPQNAERAAVAQVPLLPNALDIEVPEAGGKTQIADERGQAGKDGTNGGTTRR